MLSAVESCVLCFRPWNMLWTSWVCRRPLLHGVDSMSVEEGW